MNKRKVMKRHWPYVLQAVIIMGLLLYMSMQTIGSPMQLIATATPSKVLLVIIVMYLVIVAMLYDRESRFIYKREQAAIEAIIRKNELDRRKSDGQLPHMHTPRRDNMRKKRERYTRNARKVYPVSVEATKTKAF